MTVLVGVERGGGVIMATTVPEKRVAKVGLQRSRLWNT